jgi:hypothetical protein
MQLELAAGVARMASHEGFESGWHMTASAKRPESAVYTDLTRRLAATRPVETLNCTLSAGK